MPNNNDDDDNTPTTVTDNTPTTVTDNTPTTVTDTVTDTVTATVTDTVTATVTDTVTATVPATVTATVPATVSEHVTIETGLEIHEIHGQTADGSLVNNSTFVSTEPDKYDPDITENLVQTTETYNDVANAALMDQIKDYAAQIKCESFHGKGTVDDYTVLFQAASKIANESKSMDLNVEVEGFNEFGRAADELSALFVNFTLKLQNVNIINDVTFLQSIVSALQKIVHLSTVFGRFKETILATSSIRIPKSTYDAKIEIERVMEELQCAMNYIQYFVDPLTINSVAVTAAAQLSKEEKNIIEKAVETIDQWNVICDQGVSIAMSQDINIQYITQSSNTLKVSALKFRDMTSKLQTKMQKWSSSPELR